MKVLKKILLILFIIANLIGCSVFDNDSDSNDGTTNTSTSKSSKALFNKISSSIPLVQKSFLTDQATSSNVASQNIKFAVSGETGYETQRYRYQSLAWDGGIAKAFGEEGRLYTALEIAGIYYSIKDAFLEKGSADNLLINGKTLAQWGVTATFETINENKTLKFASPNNSVPSSLTFTTKVTIFWTSTHDGKTESGYDYAYFTKKDGSDVFYLNCSEDTWNWYLYTEENSDGTYKVAEYDTYTGSSYNGSYEYISNNFNGANDTTKIVWSTSGSKDVSASYAEKTNTNGDFKFYYFSDYSYTDVTTVTVNGVKDDSRSCNETRGYNMSTYMYGNVEKNGKFMVRTTNNSNWRNSDEWYLATYNASTKELGTTPIEMDFSDDEGTRAVKNLRNVTETDDDGNTFTYCDYDTDYFPDKKGSAINGVYGYLADKVSTSDGTYSISKSDMWDSSNMPQ